MTRTRYPFFYREALRTEKYRRYINIIIIIILFIIIIIYYYYHFIVFFTGVWYQRGHGTRLSELFKNSRK